LLLGLLEHVTVLIGIAVGTRAVAGVIHQPYYGYKEKEDCGRTIWGVLGLGAYGHTPQELPSDRVVLTTTRSHSNALVQEAINSLKADEVLRVGGAGHKVRAKFQ
jgi:3'(2'), 5'-bisphosphate nucleotidase